MATIPLALATRSNPSRFGFEGASRLINAYAETTGSDAKNPFAVYCTEGLDTWLTPSFGRTYALLATETLLYGVTGTAVWSVDLNDVITIIGTLGIAGPTYMARNRRNPTTEVGLVSADNKYYTISGNTMTLNVDPDLQGPPTSIAVRDGYFIIPTNFSRYFITGEDNATTIAPTDLGKAQRTPGNITRVMASETDIVLFKPDGIEWHQNNPSTTFSFPFVPLGNIELGLLAPAAAAKVDRTIMWLASDGTVRRMQGYNGQIVSTPAVRRAIGAVTDPTTISAFGWNARSIGHSFMAFTCPQWTWVYDLNENIWHERTSYGLPYWRVSQVVEWQGRIIAGDIANGELYDMRGDLNADGNVPIVMTVQTPTTSAFPDAAIIHQLNVDVVPGVGSNTPTTPGSNDPVLMMSYSDDGGENWSAERTTPLGRQGQTNVRAGWYRLGQVRRNGRTFRFRISASVARGLQSASLEVEKLDI